MEDEGISVIDLDEAREFTEVLLHVDDRHGVVEEDPEGVIEADIDRRRLDARLVERLDRDPTSGQLLADRAVGEDHGGTIATGCSRGTLASVYRPRHFAEDRPDVVSDLINRVGFGHLVISNDGDFGSSPIPLLVDEADDGAVSRLRGHVARANPLWRAAPCPVLVIVPGVDDYISPSWYATKQEHGRVVPTWNYDVVHVHGQLVAHDDPTWTEHLVRELTAHHETDRPQPWAVDDAPAPFVTAQVKAIVGIEIVVERIDAKRKLSQNRDAADRAGVVDGLHATGTPRARAVAAAMQEVDRPS